MVRVVDLAVVFSVGFLVLCIESLMLLSRNEDKFFRFTVTLYGYDVGVWETIELLDAFEPYGFTIYFPTTEGLRC